MCHTDGTQTVAALRLITPTGGFASHQVVNSFPIFSEACVTTWCRSLADRPGLARLVLSERHTHTQSRRDTQVLHMLRVISVSMVVAGAAAGAASSVVSLHSADLPTFWEGKRVSKILDNVKAEWSKDVVLPSPLKAAKLLLTYDLKANANFIKQASLAGAVADKVKYQITHTVASGVTSCTLLSRQAGVTYKAIGDSKELLTQLSASKTVDIASGRAALNVEPSYGIKSALAKLKLSGSLSLGGGAALASQLTATQAGDVSADYSLEYETTLGEGRTLSASLSPADREAELTLVDNKLETSATWVGTASYGLNEGYGAPKLSVRRVQKF